MRDVSAGKQCYSLRSLAMHAHRSKTNAARAKESSLVTAPAQQHRKINACVLVRNKIQNYKRSGRNEKLLVVETKQGEEHVS